MATNLGSTQQSKIKQLALSKVGSRYVWGATGPTQFDCSGLIVYLFKQAGISWNWNYSGGGSRSSQMARACNKIPWSALEIGDLVFRFDTGANLMNYGSVTHVLIYVGDGQLVEAHSTAVGVRKVPVSKYSSSKTHLAMRPKIFGTDFSNTSTSAFKVDYDADFIDVSSYYNGKGVQSYTTQNPIAPWYKPTAMPPSYYDDTLPTHRAKQGKYFLRIGDCQFFIPPLYIAVNNQSASERVPVIRQVESTQKGHGYSAREIEVTLWFNDIEQINGTEIDSGLSCGNYYMDGLRSLVAQFKKLPFLPIVNELLNDVHMIYAATLLNISFNTVPDMPGCIQAKLIMKEFNATPYLGVPTTCYDSMICWPLFRWFYQQQLVDGISYSRFKLPKIVTDNFVGSLTFKLLPEQLLRTQKADVNPEQNKYDQYSYISNEYLFMEEVDLPYEDMVISNIAITLGNIVTDLQLASHQVPTHQYMGSIDTMITVSIQTKSRALANKLVELHNTTQHYAREYKNKIATGYMGIDNELINMMGVECVTLQNMSLTTSDQQPELISISMDFLSYNKTQKDDSTPRGFTPHAILDENLGMVGKGKDEYEKPLIWEGVMEDMIQEIEAYPDLNLPVYQEVNQIIAEINKQRTSKGHKDLGISALTPQFPEKPYYVDPDFYVFYPSPIALGVIDIEAFDNYWRAYRSGGARGMLDKRLKNGTGKDFMHTVMQVLAECGKYGQPYEIPVRFAKEEATSGMPPVEEDDLYKLMLYDMYNYSKRYTLCRAFPTATFFFMDEGKRVRGVRMLNNIYAYNALISVAVYRDRDNPIDTCELTLSNIYHSLSTKPSYYDAEKKSWFGTTFIEPDEQMIAQRKELFKFMNLEAGCRVHVRIGYGSAIAGLPVVFNGIIAEIDSGPIMRILCQSDGHELTNAIPAGEESNNGLFSKGNEPSDLIGNLMTDRAGWQALYTWDGMLKKLGDFCNESRYGIEHFGNIYTSGDGLSDDLKALFHIGDEGKWSYDAMKNVYKGMPYVEDKGKYQRTTIKKWSITQPTDEYNVYMYLYGKTSWDVFKALSASNIEYIVTASPHNFRSTLFFGQPTWLYKCGFKYKGGPNIDDRKNFDNYFEHVKTYSQVHCIESMVDIIDNGTTVSSSGLATAVIPTYVNGNSVKSDFVMFADKNIYPEYQRTVYYDTTFKQDFFCPEILYTGVGINIAEDTARRAGMSFLQHSFKDMYKGQIVIIGDASIKPYDLINIQDSYRDMYGMAYVGAVTHSLSVSDGFITSIKPDLVSTTHRPESLGHARILAMATTFTNNFLIARMSMVSTASIKQAIYIYNKRSTIKEDNDVLEIGLSAVGAAAGVLRMPAGFAVAGLTLAAAAGWYVMDRAIEWFKKVFIGKDNHTISILPLMVNDRPFVAGIKGHQTLIPGYKDEVQEVQYKYDSGTPDETAQVAYQQDIEDYNAIMEGVTKRYDTGVDIFDLQSNHYESSDQELLDWASNASNNGDGSVVDKVSETSPGVLSDGKSYVHKFSKAIVSTYHEGERSPMSTASGRPATANGTICAAHNMRTGTRIYIPDLKYINGTGIFLVADTGGPSFDFDLNTPSKYSLKDNYDVYVLEWGNERTMCQTFESALGNVINVSGKDSKSHKNVLNAMAIDNSKRGGYKTKNFIQPGCTPRNVYSIDGKKL